MFYLKQDGQGKLVAPTYTYEGEWKHNARHGQGFLVSLLQN